MINAGVKECSDCGQPKPTNEYHNDKGMKSGVRNDCKICHYKKLWKSDIKRKYGMLPEDYSTLFEIQGGCCAICGISQADLKQRLCIDHIKGTFEIRGLLCHQCNYSLGHFDDNEAGVLRALEYLRLQPYKFGQGEY